MSAPWMRDRVGCCWSSGPWHLSTFARYRGGRTISGYLLRHVPSGAEWATVLRDTDAALAWAEHVRNTVHPMRPA
jgi:hypothetical protein